MPTSDDKRRLRMDAYYYGFDATGCAEVDEILSAVAWAGRMYHHTDQWTDDDPSEVDRIQVAANDCAAALSAAETARAAAEARATQAEAELDRLRRDFPPAPPLAIAGCDCAACVRLRAMWAEPDVRTVPSVREAARRRMPLDGTDAQALEGAVTITEAERDEARAERDRLRERVTAWERSGLLRGVDCAPAPAQGGDHD